VDLSGNKKLNELKPWCPTPWLFLFTFPGDERKNGNSGIMAKYKPFFYCVVFSLSILSLLYAKPRELSGEYIDIHRHKG
jgi:hypothetical protein